MYMYRRAPHVHQFAILHCVRCSLFVVRAQSVRVRFTMCVCVCVQNSFRLQIVSILQCYNLCSRISLFCQCAAIAPNKHNGYDRLLSYHIYLPYTGAGAGNKYSETPLDARRASNAVVRVGINPQNAT